MGNVCCGESIDFDGEVDLSHFSLLRSVGKGAFGKVRVVEHKRTKEIYALKYINKAKCVAMHAVENTLQERRLLEEINCPFVCNLRYAFQDDENLFMVLDLMLGGDLRFHMEKMGPFSENLIRFYAAEVGSAIAYLHSKNIAHRDLKPDNILLDQYGHAHITDFNVAIKVREGRQMTALAGSLAYMAPEIFLRRGYTAAVDWWSFGVLLYELLYGRRPFRGKNNDQLTYAILNEPVFYMNLFNDKEPISQNCTNFISELITRNVKDRLGAKESGGYVNYKKHFFFDGINWDLLETKGFQPPFVPDSKKINFDATHELEELLLEDNPLTTNKRRSSGPRTLPNGEEIPQEQLLLEEKFTVFDFSKPPVSSKPKEEATSALSTLRKVSVKKQQSSKEVTRSENGSRPSKTESVLNEILYKDVMEGREAEVFAAGEAENKGELKRIDEDPSHTAAANDQPS